MQSFVPSRRNERRDDSGSVCGRGGGGGGRTRLERVATQQWQPLPMHINILASDATYFCRYKWRHLEDQYLPRSPSIIRDPIAPCYPLPRDSSFFFSFLSFFLSFSLTPLYERNNTLPLTGGHYFLQAQWQQMIKGRKRERERERREIFFSYSSGQLRGFFLFFLRIGEV